MIPLVGFILAAGISSCNDDTQRSDSLHTANNETIALNESDKAVVLSQLDRASMNKYLNYVNVLPSFQVPLNKVFFFNHIGYYYGIPVEGSVTDLARGYASRYSSALFIDTSTIYESASFFLHDSSVFVTISVFSTEKKHLLVGAAIGTDSSAIKMIYDQKELLHRVGGKSK